MTEIYTVKRILEDDYGCEERAEGYEPQVIVILVSTEGEELTVKQPDAWLYRQSIDEGDRVWISGSRLQKFQPA